MEPIIKYERCDDLYAQPEIMEGGTTGQKRHFNDLSGDDAAGDYHHNNFMSQMQTDFQGGGFYAPVNNLQDKFSPLGTPQCAKPAKRYRRGESNVLFAPPFFELPEGVMPDHNGTVTARCLSCRVMLRGHKNVSSNFIKHMKRLHPEVYKMYENYKIFKHLGFPAVTETHSNMSSAKIPNETTVQGFYSSNAFLESLAANSIPPANTACEEERNSETTENSGTPPNSSTDVLETNENSLDSHQQDEDAETLRTTNLNSDAPSTEVNLSSKTLQAMSKLFDEKLKAFVKRTELNDMTRNISNTTEGESPRIVQSSSIETERRVGPHSPINVAMQTQLNNLRNEFQTIQQQMQQMARSKRYLQRELETLEKVARSRKIVVRNLKISDNQKPKEALEQLFKERFDLPNILIEKITMIANKNKTQNSKQNLLVELKHENDVRAIFRKCTCLKHTGIFIEPQMSIYARKRKEKLLVLRRELLRRNNELRVMVRNTQLIVCGKQFYWDDVIGLCAGNLDCPDVEEVDPVEELKKLTKLDLKEFLNVLKNYNVR